MTFVETEVKKQEKNEDFKRCGHRLAHVRRVATSVGKPQTRLRNHPIESTSVCLRDFKIPPPIENPADCEVRAVIRFLCAQGFKSVDIHHQISEVYGENIMSNGMERKWARAFKDGRTNIHDEERSGRPSVITDELIQKVDCEVKENRRFTISSLAEKFPAGSRSVLYEIVYERLNYRKLCSRWVPKMLTDEHKNQKIGQCNAFSRTIQ
ncbi:HTH_48 domain-containing protein [Trichonephila clavipes]|nr:HTH_48 domain-containing protein [Trichonephila clavipes]